MTENEQLQAWRFGVPLHDHERNQCCPDFACCRGVFLASPEERARFVTAGEPERMFMLSKWLGEAMEQHLGKKTVYVAGVETGGSA